MVPLLGAGGHSATLVGLCSTRSTSGGSWPGRGGDWSSWGKAGVMQL